MSNRKENDQQRANRRRRLVRSTRLRGLLRIPLMQPGKVVSVQAPVTVEGLLADRAVMSIVSLRCSTDGFDGDGALGDLWLLDAENSILM
jgi:hypothetical protein